MEWWHVYLFTRLAGLNTLVTIFLIVSIVATLFFTAMYFMANPDEWYAKESKDAALRCKNMSRPFVKVMPWVVLVLAVVTVAIPSQKEAAAIYLLPKLAHSDFAKEAQQIPTDAAKLMRLKLESWIADMEPKKAGSNP